MSPIARELNDRPGPHSGVAAGRSVVRSGDAWLERSPSSRHRLLGRAGVFAVVLALIAWAFTPFALTALDAARHHRIFLGVGGYYPWDGLQYLAFVRAGHAGLIANLFGLRGGAVFLDPIWSTSGIVQGLTGAGPVLILTFWKVVSIGVLCAGAARLVFRHISPSRPGRRTTALALCLFGGLTPLVALLLSSDWHDVEAAAIDLVPVATLWDYAPIAIAIGLMPFAVEGIERIVSGPASRRTVWLTAGACLLIGWLHPWQSATLILLSAGLLIWQLSDLAAEAATGGRIKALRASLHGRLPGLAAVACASAAAPVYYAILSHVDYSWAQFSQADATGLRISWPVLECCLAPLVVAAVAGAWAVRGDRAARPLVAWLGATLLLVMLAPPEQYHALDGVALPLGVLVVRAWPTRRQVSISRIAAIAGLAAIIAGYALYAAKSVSLVQSRGVTSYSELAPSDVHAVDIAAGAAAGGPILSTAALGSAIPMLVDEVTWVGNLFWTPDAGWRSVAAGNLFGGFLSVAAERRLVRSTGTRAVVEPCGSAAWLEPALAPLGYREQRVGCARVYLLARASAGPQPGE